MFRIAMDTGGTFTDFVATDQQGRMEMVKAPTDRTNPTRGIMQGLSGLAERWNTTLPAFLANTEQLVHGTTLALNALLEDKGARVALLTTEGFRDALELRRSRLSSSWDFRVPVPRLLVPRYLRFGIRERVDYKGDVLTPLDLEQVKQVALRLQEEKVEAVAICFLFSFLNPEHEQATARLLRELLPGVFVTASSDVAPRIREYERTSTTVLNATLTPVLSQYLTDLEGELAKAGWHQPLQLILNSGGLTDSLAVRSNGIKTLMSGPAGGARGGQLISSGLARPNVIIADMGGTSFDVHLIVDGASAISPESKLAGHPLALPMIDIHSIGAGGGSIARVDAGGLLLVGPESAGSYPGPACYGRGGDQPTVTDAALVLGILSPENFLQGELTLQPEKARQVIQDQVATPLGIPLVDAALAIFQVATAKMADAVRLVTVGQGLDPRGFSLLAAGGAFGMFAAYIAAELGINEVILPLQAPVFCAWGMLGAGRQHDVVQSCLVNKAGFAAGELDRILHHLRQAGDTELDRLGVPADAREREYTLEMKYADQHHEIPVPVNPGWLAADAAREIDEAFHRLHRQFFGYCEEDKPWEIVNVRLTARETARTVEMPGATAHEGTARSQDSTAVPADSTAAPQASAGTAPSRQVTLQPGPPEDLPVYHSEALPTAVTGPALLEYPYTTLLVPPGFTAVTENPGYTLLRREVPCHE